MDHVDVGGTVSGNVQWILVIRKANTKAIYERLGSDSISLIRLVSRVLSLI